MRAVKAEIAALSEEYEATARDCASDPTARDDPGMAALLLAYRAAVLRNRRCLMAYQCVGGG